MFCKNCGAKVEDNAAACANCNTKADAATPVSTKPELQTHLVPAIVATVLCCLPFGIVAIVYATQVSGKVAAGDIQGALNSARNAKIWCWVAFWCGLAILALGISGFIFPFLLQLPQPSR